MPVRLDVVRHAMAVMPEREWENERTRERDSSASGERPSFGFYSITVVFVTTRAPYVWESRSGTAGQSNKPQQPSGPILVKMSGGFDSLPFTSLPLSFGMPVSLSTRVRWQLLSTISVCVCVCVCVFSVWICFFSEWHMPANSYRAALTFAVISLGSYSVIIIIIIFFFLSLRLPLLFLSVSLLFCLSFCFWPSSSLAYAVMSIYPLQC